MCVPTSPSDRRRRVVEGVAGDAAAVLDGFAAAEAERPGREAQAAGQEQARRGGAERAHRRQHGPHHEHCARGEERDRHEVVHGADQLAQPVDEPGAALSPVPAEVDEEREEDRERDQREADQIPMALFELGHAADATPAATRGDGRAACGVRSAACSGQLTSTLVPLPLRAG